MPELFYRLPQNVAAIFRGRNLGWHALAIGLTILIVSSGLDWSYYLATRDQIFSHIALPAMGLGTIVPLLGVLIILAVGAVGKNRRLITTAWAVGQAVMLGFLISTTYKAFTGRLPPPFMGRHGLTAPGDTRLLDSSHGFQLGFLRGGLFWGWPSSHTTVAFAMSACLITLYPRNKISVGLVALYALFIGLGVSVSIHWLSEFVAGAIIGSLIGVTVGRSFKTKLARNDGE